MVDGTGKYRTMGVGGEPNTVFVKDRSISFEIGERLYRERNYLPPFDDLPWSGIAPDAPPPAESGDQPTQAAAP